jgi:response regulator RpfG family c-di-GMP phosphodiesterase
MAQEARRESTEMLAEYRETATYNSSGRADAMLDISAWLLGVVVEVRDELRRDEARRLARQVGRLSERVRAIEVAQKRRKAAPECDPEAA